MTAARSLQEAFDWTPGAFVENAEKVSAPAESERDDKKRARRPSRLAEHASAWMERAAELGLSEAQAVVIYKSDVGKVLNLANTRWRWGAGKGLAMTKTVVALHRKRLVVLMTPATMLTASRYRLTRLGMQAAMWLRGEGVARPEVPR